MSPRGYFDRKVRPVEFPIGPSIAYVPLTKGQFATIDLEDADRVGTHNWYAQWTPSTRDFYAVGFVDGARIQLHVFIAGTQEGKTVDHARPGNTLDCRRANLRHADRILQNCNQRLRHSNTSGAKGISFDKRLGKWTAEIQRGGIRKHLGTFDTRDKALERRLAAETEGSAQ